MPLARRLLLSAAPASLAALLPAAVRADDHNKKGDKGDKDDGKDERGRTQIQPVPYSPSPTPPLSREVAFGPPPSFSSRRGSDQMVSEQVRMAGADGTGAGALLLDVEGARPGVPYQVLYVPQSNPGVGLILGTVRTDAAGAFKGAAPEPLPPLPDPARLGIVVFRRLTS